MQLTATLPSTRSLAVARVGEDRAGRARRLDVAFAGTVTTGPVVSVTVTVNEAAPLLPRVSVAVQLTVVAPSGNVEPLAGVQLTATLPSTMSVAVALKVKARAGRARRLDRRIRRHGDHGPGRVRHRHREGRRSAVAVRVGRRAA